MNFNNLQTVGDVKGVCTSNSSIVRTTHKLEYNVHKSMLDECVLLNAIMAALEFCDDFVYANVSANGIAAKRTSSNEFN